MKKQAVVLFAHGSRDAGWARPFEQLASTLAKKIEASVRLAYLETMQPSLPGVIATLAKEGVTHIRVVPVFLGAGGHVKEDLPRLAMEAGARHPSMQISVEPPVGEQAAVIEALADAIAMGP